MGELINGIYYTKTNKGIEFTNPFKQKKSRFNKQKFKRINKMKKKSKIINRHK